ncbi:MAG: LysM peptidoglycan-binding domain-containing protein [Anaerolineales bacterium]|jgi:LysM repeat protein
MKRWKRLFYYLTINVLVSACTMVTILYVWQNYHAEIPFLNTINPLAIITPLSPRALFPDYESQIDTPEPTIVALVATGIPTQVEPADTQMAEMSYTVETGDTLGAIAVKFNVTVAEILAANEIPNPDALEVGQVLIILRPLVAAATHTALPAEEIEEPVEPTSSTPTSTPVPLTGESQVLIDSVIGVGDLASERVFLKRVGPGEISLTGWSLESENGETFTFPQLTLFENGAVFVHTRSGQTTAVALYWNLDQAVWSSGDTVVLIDDQGNVHSSYQIP